MKNSKNFLEFMHGRTVVFDGAFGTMLQRAVGDPGPVPERLNLSRPDVIANIHRAYAEAGADVITAVTFGANRFKTGDSCADIVRAAVDIARAAAKDKFVALDIGPTGRLAEPAGDMTFDEAYDAFAEVVEAGANADVILIETMSDMTELRAALLAAREKSDLPVIATMTFAEDMRTFTGVSAECFALVASPLADAIGVNCSLGPKELLPVAEKLVTLTPKPVIVQPNAGLPDSRGNYPVGAEEFADYAKKFLECGVRIIGGCCGTTPEHIALLADLAKRFKPTDASRYKPVAAVCSATKRVLIDGVRVIGERINPTGKKAMKEALLAGDYAYAARQAVEQAEAGADILDVNAGLPGTDETKTLSELIRRVTRVTDLPLQIDTSDVGALSRALRIYPGKAIINSVNGEEKSLSNVLPLAAKYGAAVVGLTVDERGVPSTTEERIKIAERIIERAASFGIPECDIYIDCLTLTAGAEQRQALRTLDAIRIIKSRYDVRTVLGVSNVSFGLPARRPLNTAFLTAALWAGLDLPILNPNLPENMQAIAAFNVLTCRDGGCAEWTRRYAGAETVVTEVRKSAATEQTDGKDLKTLIRKGLPTAEETKRLLKEGAKPLDIVSGEIIPALNAVGADYEVGRAFLPQLLASADSAKESFSVIRASMPAASENKGVVVMATVWGDVHDIGKNIACTVLENYGYKVIDLGKNVPPEEVVAAVKKYGASLCGLSALMTTTVPHMEKTITLLRENCPNCKIMVGGAVLTEDYAKKIGADYYCKDALSDVRIAEEVYPAR